MSTSSWTSLRARVASLSRSRPVDDRELVEAKQLLKVAQLEKVIRRVVDSEPYLTHEQAQHLVNVLVDGGERE
ncbi:hypothetical protein QDX25_00780 [Auritidibacter ignavus]|uniref:hypothetical protein n=1 Tax=Auritidibacter ignavus TaxID=678932 RepID=UPI00244B3799|nr:hypothetical protein [Auritidibacter ignavus]WGH81751.1 hypothetical protein QDX25_00780 [Auritidibacter ignavus]